MDIEPGQVLASCTSEAWEATADLRWNSGVLEQAHRCTEYSGGNPVASRIEWRPVPDMAQETE